MMCCGVAWHGMVCSTVVKFGNYYESSSLRFPI